MFEVFKTTTKEKGFTKLYATPYLTLYFSRKHIVLMKTLSFGKKTGQVALFRASGRAILCKESKNFKVEFENSDKAGRIISVTVETQKDKFQITNIYAPNIPLQR